MFKKHFFKSYQKKIRKLSPQVNIDLNYSIPIPSASEAAKLAPLVAEINAKEQDLKNKPREYFLSKTEELRGFISEQVKDISDKEDKIKAEEKILDKILPEAFSLVREAASRQLGMRHFDVQMLGGIVLHRRGIAEMATGEGKTLVATLAAYLNSLTNRGVHIVTVNDYLAKRDSEWMGPIYEFLGLSTGVIQHDMTASERRSAYSRDVV